MINEGAYDTINLPGFTIALTNSTDPMTLRVNMANNAYGNNAHNVTVEATNYGGISKSYDFNLNTVKDCSSATLTNV